MRSMICAAILVAASAAFAGGGNFEKDIDTVVKQGRGTAEGRAAWERLASAKADVVPALLEGMSTKDTVAANWIRLALDRVVERDIKAIDTAKVLAFVKDSTKQGRARRYGLELLDRLT